MSQEIKLPELGENIASGTVAKILVKAGDRIAKGQNLIELETDKAVVEIPSPQEGIIAEILTKQGAVIKVGQPVFKINSGASAPSAEAPSPAKPSTPSPATASAPKPSTPTAQPVSVASPAPVKISVAQPAAPAHDVAAAPSVRRFAREIGIDIAQVPGAGPGGRISVEDVKSYAKNLLTSHGSGASTAGIKSEPLPDFSKWGAVERQPMNNVRRKTAEHLGYAWSTIPHVTQFDKADITELEKLRKQFSTKDKKLSITPFLIKVIAAALKNFPQFNTSIDMNTQEIIYKKYINIGVAVDTDRGLIVPVLKNVDQMTIMQISNELTAVAERARNKKTTIEEMHGGCFTISNLGGIGGTMFTPIVNAPEVAILGVSRGVMEQTFLDGSFAPRLMLPLSLSYDHRIIDGADGARFIRWICDAIQQPFLMDLEKT